MADCIFCKIVAGTIPSHKLYEDDRILVILDAFPVTSGHMLIFPKEHYQELSDLPQSYHQEMMTACSKLVGVVSVLKGVTGVNLVQNNGVSAGQSIPHVHFHVIPRRENDNLFSFPPSSNHIISNEQAGQILDVIKPKL